MTGGIARIARDEGGATLVEFALILPALLVTLFGVFDLATNLYTQSLLRGAIHKAARDSTIEGAADSQTAIDARVGRAVQRIVPGAAISYDRMAYANFSDVGQPEDFSDLDDDGECNNNEPFEDANGNGAWDSDRGQAGMGAARDAVLYTVTVRHERAFPIASFIGLSDTVTTSAATVLRNQPYSSQQTEVAIGNCS